jgi:hypothetical protein
VKTAADLATKYRKNVQYNLEATKGSWSPRRRQAAYSLEWWDFVNLQSAWVGRVDLWKLDCDWCFSELVKNYHQRFIPAIEMEHIKNIVYPGTGGATTCGYCSPPGQRSEEATSYHAATLQALKLSCSVGMTSYTSLSDLTVFRHIKPWLTADGVDLVHATYCWPRDSRSYFSTGNYCYKPDLRTSCCPQYTIKWVWFISYIAIIS